MELDVLSNVKMRNYDELKIMIFLTTLVLCGLWA